MRVKADKQNAGPQTGVSKSWLTFGLVGAGVPSIIPAVASIVAAVPAVVPSVVAAVPAVVAPVFAADVAPVNPMAP